MRKRKYSMNNPGKGPDEMLMLVKNEYEGQ
jgi:hypothetical protein